MYGGYTSEPSKWENDVMATWTETQDLISGYSGEDREDYESSFEALRPEVEALRRSLSNLRISEDQITRSEFRRRRANLQREARQMINRLKSICRRIETAKPSSSAPEQQKD